MPFNHHGILLAVTERSDLMFSGNGMFDGQIIQIHITKVNEYRFDDHHCLQYSEVFLWGSDMTWSNSEQLHRNL